MALPTSVAARRLQASLTAISLGMPAGIATDAAVTCDAASLEVKPLRLLACAFAVSSAPGRGRPPLCRRGGASWAPEPERRDRDRGTATR
jgi:hypothetical protein